VVISKNPNILIMNNLLTLLMGLLVSVREKKVPFSETRCKKLLKTYHKVFARYTPRTRVRVGIPRYALVYASAVQLLRYSINYHLLYRLLLPDKLSGGCIISAY